jgi:hypothetical protein
MAASTFQKVDSVRVSSPSARGLEEGLRDGGLLEGLLLIVNSWCCFPKEKIVPGCCAKNIWDGHFKKVLPVIASRVKASVLLLPRVIEATRSTASKPHNRRQRHNNNNVHHLPLELVARIRLSSLDC